MVGVTVYLTSAGTMTPVHLEPEANCRLSSTALVALQNPNSAFDSRSYLTFLLMYLASGLNSNVSSTNTSTCGCGPQFYELGIL